MISLGLLQADVECEVLYHPGSGTDSVLTQAGLTPTGMVLHDHGFGKNGTSFGGESNLV